MTHKTVRVLVWADVDEGIAGMVRYLNTIPGVTTHASCQGTLGEGGAEPYRPQVLASWTPEAGKRLAEEFDITPQGECWGYLHPREGKPRTSIDDLPAVKSAISFILDEVAKKRCDSEGVADCVRCNSVFLAKKMKEFLGNFAARGAGEGDR